MLWESIHSPILSSYYITNLLVLAISVSLLHH